MMVNDFFGRYMQAHPEVAAVSRNPLPVQLLEPQVSAPW
jgi:hypothetical protein